MTSLIDFRVLELLSSRLCHDLVGPIGAVGNGLELLEDESFDMAEDAMKLASASAQQAANALQFYRLAYGVAGSRIGSDFPALRELASGFVAHSKSKLDWPDSPVPENGPEDIGKLVLNMIALASESLPRGGHLTVDVIARPDGVTLSILAAGENAGLRPESEIALKPDVAIGDLTARNVQGYFTRFLSRRMGSDLVVDASAPGRVRFLVEF